MKFGHRGANHPVLELSTKRVTITTQNHGFAIDGESLKGTGLEVTQVAVNDGTIEGIRHRELPVFAVQYHPEGAPGPRDSVSLFDEFCRFLSGS
jgi:carbamoyl-phosphate synthase small subunit